MITPKRTDSERLADVIEALRERTDNIVPTSMRMVELVRDFNAQIDACVRIRAVYDHAVRMRDDAYQRGNIAAFKDGADKLIELVEACER